MTDTDWTTIDIAHPAAHARYVVRRASIIFTATPCYGMHAPWWVPRVPKEGGGIEETDPILMQNSDRWIRLEDDR